MWVKWCWLLSDDLLVWHDPSCTHDKLCFIDHIKISLTNLLLFTIYEPCDDEHT